MDEVARREWLWQQWQALLTKFDGDEATAQEAIEDAISEE